MKRFQTRRRPLSGAPVAALAFCLVLGLVATIVPAPVTAQSAAKTSPGSAGSSTGSSAGSTAVDKAAAIDYDKLTADVIARSFRAQGQAGMNRLDQDLAQKACSGAQPPSAAVMNQIQEAALATIKWPSDGKYLGDWKAGEKLAQSGRGLTWRDKPDAGNGGSCYNCHQVGKEEISYGTIGPSLYNYGKLRGVRDPADPVSEPIVKYTWGKIYNAKAYNACSDMPRMGHMGVLSEQQIRDAMALLLDPASPVNQ